MHAFVRLRSTKSSILKEAIEESERTIDAPCAIRANEGKYETTSSPSRGPVSRSQCLANLNAIAHSSTGCTPKRNRKTEAVIQVVDKKNG